MKNLDPRPSAAPLARDRARTLRRASTDAERALWKRLRNRQLRGAKFRRQYPIGPYIADLLCLEASLVIELDGGGHAGEEQCRLDRKRSSYLESCGYRVLRFWNDEVANNVDGVLERISEYL